MQIQKTTILIALSLFFSSAAIFSQDFLPGTVILQSGQKESGYISVNRWGTTSQQIRFKTADGNMQEYGKRDLQSFEITRKDHKTERYACKVVQINRSPMELPGLEIGPTPSMAADTLIMQVSLQADFTLYVYAEGKTKHLFIEKDSIRELIYKRFFVNDQITNRLSENNRFRQQLLAFTRDCPDLQHRIQKMTCNDHDIQKLLIDYCACKNITVAYINRPERIKPYSYIIAGAAQTRPHISTTTDKEFTRVNLKNAYTPVFGLGIALPFPRTRGGIWFANDVSWWSMRTSGAFKVISMDKVVLSEFEMNMKVSGIRWQSTLRWYLWAKIGLFAEGGFQYGYILSSNGSQTRKNHNVTTTYSIDKMPQTNKGICMGIGLRKKRFSLVGRYDFTKGISPEFIFGNDGLPIATFSLFLTYQLFP